MISSMSHVCLCKKHILTYDLSLPSRNAYVINGDSQTFFFSL